MTQEQFEALGIDRSLAKKAAEESTKELDGYVKKESYDQLDQEKKQLETSVADHKKQLEDLKKTAGDNATLTQQIADFQTQMQQKEADHQKEIKDLKLTSAIKMAVAASAQDGDLVAGLIARDKLILGDDGKVAGLDEQVKALKESKPFLFKQEEKPNPKRGFFPLGGKQSGSGKDGNEDHMTMKEAIAAKLNLGAEGKE